MTETTYFIFYFYFFKLIQYYHLILFIYDLNTNQTSVTSSSNLCFCYTWWLTNKNIWNIDEQLHEQRFNDVILSATLISTDYSTCTTSFIDKLYAIDDHNEQFYLDISWTSDKLCIVNLQELTSENLCFLDLNLFMFFDLNLFLF